MPIFGNTHIGGGITPHGSDFKSVSNFLLEEKGLITKLSIFCAGNGVLKGLIYSDSSGTPDSLLALSEEITLISSPSWQDTQFKEAIQLDPGQYWLGLIVPQSTTVYLDLVTNRRKYNSDLYSDGPTNPFGGGITTDNGLYSIYATYKQVDEVIWPHFNTTGRIGW